MKRNSLVASAAVALAATLSVGFVNITPKVIYGTDDRRDVYEVESSAMREVSDSTVALIPSSKLTLANGAFTIRSSTFGTEMNLCKNEPYYDQPTAANCSGSLIGDDLIATAGHCISNSDCRSYSFVFGFQMQDWKTAPQSIPEQDVYSCKEIVAREYTSLQDYAIVRLDRPVQGRRVLTLAQSPSQPGDEIYVVGHPSGLPTKVATGAAVRSQEGTHFVANLDTYGGNSGSAVLNAQTHEVVGILVRGAQDFTYDRANSCTRSNVCTDTGCRGEDVTNISYVVEALKK
ncbi:Trypsin [compost metagenome]